MVTASWYKACRVPRTSRGPISAMYTGMAEEIIPEPTPVMMRARHWEVYVGATPDRNVASRHTPPPYVTVFLRPRACGQRKWGGGAGMDKEHCEKRTQSRIFFSRSNCDDGFNVANETCPFRHTSILLPV